MAGAVCSVTGAIDRRQHEDQHTAVNPGEKRRHRSRRPANGQFVISTCGSLRSFEKWTPRRRKTCDGPVACRDELIPRKSVRLMPPLLMLQAEVSRQNAACSRAVEWRGDGRGRTRWLPLPQPALRRPNRHGRDGASHDNRRRLPR